MRHFLFFIFSVLVLTVQAQSDPVRATTIAVYTKLSEAVYNAQDATQMMIQGGHIVMRRDIEETTAFQKQYNDYLDKFHNVVTMAAATYGIYSEFNRTIKRIDGLQDAVTNHPENVMAVLFSSKRNKVYVVLAAATTDMLNDIKMIFESNTKLTHKDQLLFIQGIRPKIKTVNQRLLRTEMAVRYTSMADLWSEISYKHKNTHTRKEIAEQSIRNWKANVKKK